MIEPQTITDPHIIIAIICLVGVALIAGGLLIWLAIDDEMRRKK